MLPSRLIAKIFLFRTIFRGSGWAFARDPDFAHVSSDPDYWEERNARFYSKYAGLDQTHQQWFARVAERKPIIGPTGRSWKIDLAEKRGRLVVPITQAANYPVQGTGADIMMVARLSFFRRIKERGWSDVLLVSTVHDSIVVDCPTARIEEVAKLFHEVFNDLPKNFQKLFNVKMPIPFPCETKFGHNLGEMEKIEYT